MARIRVLVVDDSVVIRRLVTDALSGDPEIDVVGVAANGQIALSKVAQLVPDVITMDIEMPVMNGIEAVRALRRSGNRAPIIMFSTLTERGAIATLDALSAGASDYVAKPSNLGSIQQSLAAVAGELIPRIKALAAKSVPRTVDHSRPAPRDAGTTAPLAAGPAPRYVPTGSAVPRPRLRPLPAGGPRTAKVVVLGSSTGGPEALSRFIKGLPKALPVPLVVVQHMPPLFTTQLAARLDRLGPSTVIEAKGGELLEAGTIYIAPGDNHLELKDSPNGVRTALHQGPPVNFCRPSVDVLFRSAAKVYGGDLLSVILTGMGADGRAGCSDIVDVGGVVLVQDEPTSVVWGMPGSVATAGLAHAILPLEEIAAAVVRALSSRTAPGGDR